MAMNFAGPWQRMEKRQLAVMLVIIAIFAPVIFMLVDITMTTGSMFGLIFMLPFIIILAVSMFFFWSAYSQSKDRLIKVVMFRPDILIGTIDNALRYHRIGFERESFYRDFPWKPMRTFEVFNVIPYDIRITIIRANNRISWVALDPLTDVNQQYIEYMKQIIDTALDFGVQKRWNRLDYTQLVAMGMFIVMALFFGFMEKESSGTFFSPIVLIFLFAPILSAITFFQTRGYRIKTFNKSPEVAIPLIETMLMQRYPRFRKTICGGSPIGFPVRYIEIFSDDVQNLFIKVRKQYMNVTVIDVGRETKVNKEVIREITESIDAALNVTMIPPAPVINSGGLGGYQQHAQQQVPSYQPYQHAYNEEQYQQHHTQNQVQYRQQSHQYPQQNQQHRTQNQQQHHHHSPQYSPAEGKDPEEGIRRP